jgi:acyl-CoA dehydrogenase
MPASHDSRGVRSPYFTSEHEAFRRSVRDFMAREVLPFADEWERCRRIPKSLWVRMGSAGFLGLHLPAAYGGGQRDFFYSVAFLEEVGRAGYGGFRGALAVHAYMAIDYIARAGSDALKRRYLSAAIRGDKLAALALSERDAGSDLARIRTTATRDGGAYILNGSKMFVTSGITGDFFVVAARTARAHAGAGRGAAGLSMLVVDNRSPGIRSEEVEKIGWRCSDTAEVVFDDVRVPAENLVGLENHAGKYIMQCMQLERLVAAIAAVGSADRCLELAREQLARRVAFDAPLARMQALRHRMADMATRLEAARQLVHHTAWLYQQGDLPVVECSMAKLAATEAAKQIADECLQFHGGYGYLEGSAVGRLYADLRVGTIVGGASEVMREIIAQVAVDGLPFHSIADRAPKGGGGD